MSGDFYGQNRFVPPMPSSPPPAPPDAGRAVAVALLNLSGLGLGYALMRRWVLAAVCWAATVVLLLMALPADADGVPGLALGLYVVFLVLTAVHGAVVALRTRLAWPGRSPIAILLGVALLAVPVGGSVLYDNARQEAIEQALLDRLQKADDLVTAAGRDSFGSGKSDYRSALETYRNLAVHHSGSRAAAEVPDRMRTYYATVGAAYGHKNYCDAVAPLEYLRTVPDTMPKDAIGSLRTWPDDRLATSLYECGSQRMSGGDSDWVTQYGNLLDTFPDSEPAAKVAPAVGSAVDAAAKEVHGDDPCAAVSQLRELKTQIGDLSGSAGEQSSDLGKDADRAGAKADAGDYDCGVHQYKHGDFDEAQQTLTDFASAHKHDKNRARAQKIAIAAEIAQTIPAAGKKLPSTASGGGISVTVKNDSPDDITVLYTGPVTGSFTLKACGSCKAYSFTDTITPGFKPCSSGKSYPQRTISLPAGTTYFVHKPKNRTTSSPAKDTAKISSGYIYTECSYTTRSLGSGY